MPIQKALTTQVDLKHTLQRLFPDKNIVTNARKLGQISSQSSGLYLELDFYIPDDKISFEFQDPYHYATSWTYSPLQKTQEADGLKQKSVSERGETLIIVPCWWRGDDESLIATIREQRQDLFPKKLSSKPIPLVPPVELIQGCDIPGVGELMLATFAMSSSDFTNWWESEKYDGMRMCWNPKVKSLYNQYDPVSFPLLKFPDCFLDGEIWFGRGSFTESQPSRFGNVNWPLLRFVSFDCPDVASCNLPFEDRFHLLLESVPSSHPFVIISAQKKSENRAQMRNNITMVLEDGGEGIVLRQPLSVYQHGRSNYLVKFKASRDAEALVVHDLGVGWFLLQLPNQVQFEAKETQNKLIYGDKIKKGEVVTFSYDAYGKEGIPKNAKIVRKRPEISWMNVVYNFSKERHAKSLNNVTISSLSETTTRNPQGYWTDSLKEGNEKDNNNNEISNLRKFFVDIAKERNMDPLLPENWYSLRNREIRQYKGASAVLFHFQSSLSKALLEAFPEIGLKIEDFHRHSFKYWNNAENRKKFFDTFAK